MLFALSPKAPLKAEFLAGIPSNRLLKGADREDVESVRDRDSGGCSSGGFPSTEVIVPLESVSVKLHS